MIGFRNFVLVQKGNVQWLSTVLKQIEFPTCKLEKSFGVKGNEKQMLQISSYKGQYMQYKTAQELDVFLSKCCLENSRFIIHTIVNKHRVTLYNYNDKPVGNCASSNENI